MLTHDVRAYIYRALAAASPLLGVYGFAEDQEILLYLGIAAAVLGNGLAVINTSNVRQWIYGIVLAVQALVIYLNLATEMEAELWVNLISVVIGSAGSLSATVNTPSEPDFA